MANKLVTLDGLEAFKEKSDATYASSSHTHKKSEITDFPTIPTKTSQLTNDSGFTTNKGTVTSVKVGSTSYSPTSGVISLPAYPTVTDGEDGTQYYTKAIDGTCSDTLSGSGGNNYVLSKLSTQRLPQAGDYVIKTYSSPNSYGQKVVVAQLTMANSPTVASDNTTVTIGSYSYYDVYFADGKTGPAGADGPQFYNSSASTSSETLSTYTASVTVLSGQRTPQVGDYVIATFRGTAGYAFRISSWDESGGGFTATMAFKLLGSNGSTGAAGKGIVATVDMTGVTSEYSIGETVTVTSSTSCTTGNYIILRYGNTAITDYRSILLRVDTYSYNGSVYTCTCTAVCYLTGETGDQGYGILDNISYETQTQPVVGDTFDIYSATDYRVGDYAIVLPRKVTTVDGNGNKTYQDLRSVLTKAIAVSAAKKTVEVVAIIGGENAATIPTASSTNDGLMSAADKIKLNGIATGANKIPYFTVGTNHPSSETTTIQNLYDNIAAAFDGAPPVVLLDVTGYFVKFGVLDIVSRGNVKLITFMDLGAQSIYSGEVSSTDKISVIFENLKPLANTDLASTTTDGLMSAEDKTKVNRFTYDASTPKLTMDGGAAQVICNDDTVELVGNAGVYANGSKVVTSTDLTSNNDLNITTNDGDSGLQLHAVDANLFGDNVEINGYDSLNLVGNSVTVNDKPIITPSDIHEIDTWYGGAEDLYADNADGINWKEPLALYDSSGNAFWECAAYRRVPIVAGHGIEFEPDSDLGIVQINATGGSGGSGNVQQIYQVIDTTGTFEIPIGSKHFEFTITPRGVLEGTFEYGYETDVLSSQLSGLDIFEKIVGNCDGEQWYVQSTGYMIKSNESQYSYLNTIMAILKFNDDAGWINFECINNSGSVGNTTATSSTSIKNLLAKLIGNNAPKSCRGVYNNKEILYIAGTGNSASTVNNINIYFTDGTTTPIGVETGIKEITTTTSSPTIIPYLLDGDKLVITSRGFSDMDTSFNSVVLTLSSLTSGNITIAGYYLL